MNVMSVLKVLGWKFCVCRGVLFVTADLLSILSGLWYRDCIYFWNFSSVVC